MRLKPSMVEVFMSTLSDRGMCNARVLQDVVEDELQSLLGMSTQVRFSDLKFPLTIVASDIKKHSVKVWNKKETPNESVAKAVSCSCAIPGYFKPVDKRYLDGGLLSNLPVSFLSIIQKSIVIYWLSPFLMKRLVMDKMISKLILLIYCQP